jgi:hypothetical protein
MSDSGVFHVQQFQLDSVWPEAKPLIQSALDTGKGEMNADQARYALTKGLAELFVAKTNDKIDGVALVEFMNYPNYRIANVIAIGGRGVIKHWDGFKQWLRLGGASYVEGHCYDSISRLWESKLGLEKAYTVMRGKL